MMLSSNAGLTSLPKGYYHAIYTTAAVRKYMNFYADLLLVGDYATLSLSSLP